MDLPHVRSLLFAPGSDGRKLAKALSSGADAVVCDLEDAVAPPDKEAARNVVADALAGAAGGPARLVRVNAVGTPWHDDDLALALASGVDALVLPKSSPEAVATLGPEGPPVVAIVETAMGLRQAFEIGSQARVAALILGAVDLGAEVGLEPRPDAQEILYARSRIAIDSAAAGLRGPFDVVHLDFGDEAGLEEQCRLARALGFRGKACIHPAQVETINREFAPSEGEIEWARGVVEAFEGQSEGVLAVNGAMVDRPVVERARRVLEEAEAR
jgi:citrate lyase subunit beta/citryl-CoA lyase